MSTTGVIFDMDGLLVDSEPLWQEAEMEFLAAHGHSYDPFIARRHAGLRFTDVIAVMQREYLLAGDPKALVHELIDLFLSRYLNKLRLLPGADEAIRGLGVIHPAAIASSSPLTIIRHVVRRFKWDPLLAALCSGDEVCMGKPAPDLFLLAAKRLRVPPIACCVLEDTLTGVRAAKAAGMRCIAIPTLMFGDPREFTGLADIVLGSLTELRPEMVVGWVRDVRQSHL